MLAFFSLEQLRELCEQAKASPHVQTLAILATITGQNISTLVRALWKRVHKEPPSEVTEAHIVTVLQEPNLARDCLIWPIIDRELIMLKSFHAIQPLLAAYCDVIGEGLEPSLPKKKQARDRQSVVKGIVAEITQIAPTHTASFQRAFTDFIQNGFEKLTSSFEWQLTEMSNDNALEALNRLRKWKTEDAYGEPDNLHRDYDTIDRLVDNWDYPSLKAIATEPLLQEHLKIRSDFIRSAMHFSIMLIAAVKYLDLLSTRPSMTDSLKTAQSMLLNLTGPALKKVSTDRLVFDANSLVMSCIELVRSPQDAVAS